MADGCDFSVNPRLKNLYLLFSRLSQRDLVKNDEIMKMAGGKKEKNAKPKKSKPPNQVIT